MIKTGHQKHLGRAALSPEQGLLDRDTRFSMNHVFLIARLEALGLTYNYS